MPDLVLFLTLSTGDGRPSRPWFVVLVLAGFCIGLAVGLIVRR